MNKKIYGGAFILLSLFTLAGCNKNKTEEYTTKEINVIYPSETIKTNIRFYSETKEVPYIGIKNYYKLLLRNNGLRDKSDMIITTEDDVNYKLKAPKGEATINVKDDILTSPNYGAFNINSSYIEGSQTISYDGCPWIKLDEINYITPIKPKTLDFGAYHIDIHADSDDVYFPIATLGDMFTGMNLLASGYNNKDLYICGPEMGLELHDLPVAYREELFKETKSKEYLDYSYNETCFFYDNLAGRPGRSALEKKFDISKGLDNALESKEIGKTIKSYLHSDDVAKYIAGLELLGYLLADGGHTSYRKRRATEGASWFTEEVNAKMTELIDAAKVSPEIQYGVNNNILTTNLLEIRQLRQKALNSKNMSLIGTSTYRTKGDTAMIHIDDFMSEYENREEWLKYYSGKRTTIPYSESEGSAVAGVFKGLENARNDANIKNVVIELTCNSGGSTDEMLYLISLLTNANNNSLVFEDGLTGRTVETKFKIDRNLDRKFDELDDTFDAVGDLNVVVISSTGSFSCGGVCPIYLHDYGVPVIGDNCGGGSCAIIDRTDGLGIINIFSAPYHILSPKGHVGVDDARFSICDVEIAHPKTTVDSVTYDDYSLYYDLEYLSNLINNM